ncbi:cardiolipin synthase ClsB [Polaromonas sp. C04]|uniref:cardiolipin synthase ClsB n=1 Tax=Polaromonas sp. C04 TaxID=1945857 RepID=UPI00098792D5|nr:cardiolipin synthase ClsB [Polaromonas sp. C04]OOG58603.1 cardiolipin synthase B [Polaromonas sp. C04]
MPRPDLLQRREHQIQLLQGSKEFFPALIEAVDLALAEVRLETYIFDFTGTSAGVAQALERAAQRGVTVQLVVDGVGTGTFPPEWRERFDRAGVQWRVYAPLGPLGYLLPSRWRRLHRKLCVVDGQVSFCGGINILDDLHDPNYGTLMLPRLDFAVRASGMLVQEMRDTMALLWWRLQAVRDTRQRNFPAALSSLRTAAGYRHGTQGSAKNGADDVHFAKALLLLRDNVHHRSKIERAYRKAIGEARQEIIIANAYFVPGRKLRRALKMAAQRGVKVQLLLQGKYEYFMQYHAARPVYGALLAAGVEIYEYSASFLHAKVAVVDGRWVTVGSSNLDPLSLLLAREANVVVNDAGFAADLRGRLVRAMENGGQRVDAAQYAGRPWRQRLRDRIAFGLMRAALFVTGYRY